MSALSQLLRVVAVLALLICLVAGQSSSSSSSSALPPAPSASSSSSSFAPVAPSSSSPSSSALPPLPSSSSAAAWVSSSTAVPGSSTSASAAAVSSSSSSSAMHFSTPFITALSGCGANATMNGTAANNGTGCDGTAASVITIMGGNFTASSRLSRSWADTLPRPTMQLTVRITCKHATYSPTVQEVTPTMVHATTPAVDKLDTEQACALIVINPDGATSNTLPIAFATWSSDISGDVSKWLGMGMAALVGVMLVVLLVFVIVLLCVLSVCCGVSLACLNVCCPRRRQPTIVIASPQSSGYSSMA